eukprot:scaffold7432_cov107-Isochrysis_galbana.AAC.4
MQTEGRSTAAQRHTGACIVTICRWNPQTTHPPRSRNADGREEHCCAKTHWRMHGDNAIANGGYDCLASNWLTLDVDGTHKQPTHPEAGMQVEGRSTAAQRRDGRMHGDNAIANGGYDCLASNWLTLDVDGTHKQPTHPEAGMQAEGRSTAAQRRDGRMHGDNAIANSGNGCLASS